MLALKDSALILIPLLYAIAWYVWRERVRHVERIWDPSPADYVDGKHSCSHCERILIRLPSHWRPETNSVLMRLEITVADVIQASAEGCPLLILYLTRGVRAKNRRYASLGDIFTAIFTNSQIHYYTGLKSRWDRLVYFLHSLSNRPFYIRLARFDPEAGGSPYLQLYHEVWHSNEIDVSADKDNVAARFITERPANRNVVSEDSFRYARRWLDDCLSCRDQHSNCEAGFGHEDSHFTPTRLIQVQTRADSSLEGRIYHTEQGDKLQWCCLSYCWGGDQRIKLLKANLHALSKALPPDLPRTIQDAMLVTQQMGMRYLWVDALCIIQDDQVDVALEISRLPHIYQDAQFTISASSAKTHLDGFLAPRCHDAVIPRYKFVIPTIYLRCAYPIPDTSDNTTATTAQGELVLSTREPHYQHLDEPIHKRAWTFQERLLSTRVIDYCSDKLRWTCRGAGTVADGGSALVNHQWATLPGSEALAALPALERDKLWQIVLTRYTERDMTFASDRLLALAAAAAEFARAFGCDQRRGSGDSGYAAGLWRVALVQQMAWWVPSYGRRERPVAYTGPSWSWAGIQGQVGGFFDSQRNEQGEPEAEVVDCAVNLESENLPFGAVKNARLVIKGRMREIVWLYNRAEVLMPGRRPGDPALRFYNDRPRREASGEEGVTHFFGEPTMDAIETSWSVAEDAEMKAWCLKILGPTSIFGSRCIILVEDADSNGERVYKRVGHVRLGDSSYYSYPPYSALQPDFFDKIEPQTVVII